MAKRSLLFGLLVVFFVVLVWSGIRPFDRFTWWLEVAPALIVLPVLWFTYSRFPLTPLLYILITIHAVILMIGGHYTYAEVPAGFWVQDQFGMARNPYDRLGHFAQGFIPAMVAREVLLRHRVVERARWAWLFLIVVCICLAISASYELVEWQAAVWFGGGAEAFLGTQGDIWDTQWDMALALMGSITAQLLLSRLQDAQIARLQAATASAATA